MPIKERTQFALPKLFAKTASGKIRELRDKIVFDLTSPFAVDSIGTESEPRSIGYFTPVGFYLDTNNEKEIQRAKNYWIEAFKAENFTLIAERDIPGSRFSAFIFGTRDKRNLKKRTERLEKQAQGFMKKFQKFAKFVAVATTFAFAGTVAPLDLPKPVDKPPVVEVSKSVEESKDIYRGLFKKIHEDAGDAAEVAEGIVIALGWVLPPRDKKKKKSDDDDD
jgi:hypothetical protein